MAASELESLAHKFAESYAALFSSPDTSSLDKVAFLAEKISKNYRPGVTFFTQGQISRFETQSQASHLIETEMKKNIHTGLGTCLLLQKIETRAYSDSAVTCWLEWKFRPQKGSEFEGRGWTFTNIYGFRKGSSSPSSSPPEEGDVDGWEYVVRDREVEAMREVTGGTFLE